MSAGRCRKKEGRTVAVEAVLSFFKVTVVGEGEGDPRVGGVGERLLVVHRVREALRKMGFSYEGQTGGLRACGGWSITNERVRGGYSPWISRSPSKRVQRRPEKKHDATSLKRTDYNRICSFLIGERGGNGSESASPGPEEIVGQGGSPPFRARRRWRRPKRIHCLHD